MMIAEGTAGTPGMRAASGVGRLATWQCTHSMGSDALNGSAPVSIW
jgi:hypothetical protein